MPKQTMNNNWPESINQLMTLLSHRIQNMVVILLKFIFMFIQILIKLIFILVMSNTHGISNFIDIIFYNNIHIYKLVI